MRRLSAFSATLELVGEELPTEFRLFRAGVNDTIKGPTLYDERARDLVLEAYAKHGVDLMLDLEHDSLDGDARASRSDAADAKAWFKIEDRGGELWAYDVRWTPDGARRLREKTQRYISPAFYEEDVEGQDGLKRVSDLVNAALCAMPATHNAAPLVAASRRAANVSKKGSRKMLSAEKVLEAIDIVAADDGAKAVAMLREMIAAAAGGEEAPAESPADEALAEEPGAPAEDPAKAAGAAALTALCAQLGVKDVKELSAKFEAVAALGKKNDEAEAIERAELVGQLVKLRVETPATAWSDADKRIPKPRLVSEPIAELRERVKALSAANGDAPRGPQAPTGPDEIAEKVRRLSAGTLAKIQKLGVTPEEFVKRRETAARRM